MINVSDDETGAGEVCMQSQHSGGCSVRPYRQKKRAQCAGFVATPCFRCTWDLRVYSSSVGGDWCSSDTAKLFFERKTIVLDGVDQHFFIHSLANRSYC